MKLKLKVAFLSVLMILFTLLLIIPPKAEAGVVYVYGTKDYQNGIYICYCTGDGKTCACSWHFSDIE